MNKAELVAELVGGALELADVPEGVVDIVESEIEDLADWIESELAGGKDPQAQLRALMGTAESAAKALEDAELGPPK